MQRPVDHILYVHIYLGFLNHVSKIWLFLSVCMCTKDFKMVCERYTCFSVLGEKVYKLVFFLS